VPEELLLPGAGDASGEPDPAETICSCNAVTRGDLERAIASRGLRTVAQVGRVTRATTGCGGCTEEVESLLASRSRNTADAAGKPQPSRMGT